MGKGSTARLGEVCEINPSAPKSLNPDAEYAVIPMDAVSTTGKVGYINWSKKTDISKGLTSFREGDVLFAKITPCMENGKSAIVPKINNIFGFGSTEFHVLRPNERINVQWLFHLVHSESFRKLAEQKMTGSAGQKRVPLSFLEKYTLPLPPLEIQRKIADVLDRAAALIEKRKAQIEKLDLLVKSRFVEMFGDPVLNPYQWEKVKLAELGSLNRGKSKHRPRNAPELLGGDYPLIQTGDVANAGVFITEYSATYSALGLAQSKMWNRGTLCITIAANIAKTGILTFDACFPDSVVGFLPAKKTNTFFIYFWFCFLQKLLEDQAPESAQKNINLDILNELEVICPPIGLQSEFAFFVEEVERKKVHLQYSLSKLDSLYASLMQKCFRGEIF